IERKMFHITQIGVVLLTLTLCTGLFYMHNLFSMENIDKAVLSIVAWFVYIVLLWGHYHEGWRGRRVVWFNVAGAVILTLAYFGSRIVQQLIS
ncbi:TPA: cytochrome c biogenesis protein CcsA, partial [Escherichia coli]